MATFVSSDGRHPIQYRRSVTLSVILVMLPYLDCLVRPRLFTENASTKQKRVRNYMEVEQDIHAPIAEGSREASSRLRIY